MPNEAAWEMNAQEEQADRAAAFKQRLQQARAHPNPQPEVPESERGTIPTYAGIRG